MSNTKTKTTLTTAHGGPNKVGLYTTLNMGSKYVSKYNYTMVRLKASLVCCTHLHYHRQKLPKTEWSFEFQDTSLSRRQMAMEGKTLRKLSRALKAELIFRIFILPQHSPSAVFLQR